MKQLSKEEVLSIVELVQTHSTKEIAELFGVTPTAISRWKRVLREEGYDVPASKAGKKPVIC